MTDLTTRPTDSLPALTPINGVAVADTRTVRHASRAEQDRISADAQVDRRDRAARLAWDLREQQHAAARRDRQAKTDDKAAHAEQRRAGRAARRIRVRAACVRGSQRALFIAPILFPMAVAWVGQIRFAITVMHWPLPAAIVFAAGFELSTAYVARLDWQARTAGDSALIFRAATWAFAGGAAVMNYWHAAGPGLTPNGEAVSYGLMSITGVILWELYSTYRHRTVLRAEGRLPAARPRFGLARWTWFTAMTYLAWLIALRDAYPTTDLAWRAAISAVNTYGSTRAARKAVRAGQPIPIPETGTGTGDGTGTGNGDAHEHNGCPRDDRDSRDKDRDSGDNERDAADRPGDDDERDDDRDERNDDWRDTNESDHTVRDDERDDATALPVTPDRTRRRRRSALARTANVVGAQMEAYARTRLADGQPVSGADLDRQFGTSDYGRKVLRRLTANGTAH